MIHGSVISSSAKVVGGHLTSETAGETDEGSEVYLKIASPQNNHVISTEQCEIEIRATERDVKAGTEGSWVTIRIRALSAIWVITLLQTYVQETTTRASSGSHASRGHC